MNKFEQIRDLLGFFPELNETDLTVNITPDGGCTVEVKTQLTFKTYNQFSELLAIVLEGTQASRSSKQKDDEDHGQEETRGLGISPEYFLGHVASSTGIYTDHLGKFAVTSDGHVKREPDFIHPELPAGIQCNCIDHILERSKAH